MGESRPVKLCSVRSRIEAEMMIDILKQNRIPSYRKPIGSAEVMDIYTGNSIYGEDIFVNQNDIDRAKEVTGELFQNKNEERYEAQKKQSSTGKIIIVAVLVVFAAVIGWIFFFGV